MISLILLFLGLLLIFLEFFLPGGIAAAIGVVLLIFSIAFFAVGSSSLFYLLLYIIAVLILTGVLIKVTLWAIKSGRTGKNIYLQSDQEGFVASQFAKELIGKEGVAITDLKPAGHVLVENRRVQALSKSGYLVKGSKVVVVGGHGGYLIVKKESE